MMVRFVNDKDHNAPVPRRCRWFGHKWKGVIVLGSPEGALRRECKRCPAAEWVNSL